MKKQEGDVINSLSIMLKSIAAGDKNAMKQLYDSMSKDIYTFLLIVCRDRFTAEDAMQETLIAIYEKAGSYRFFKNPRAWILTIAKNKAISIIRKNSHTVNAGSMENLRSAQSEIPENAVLDQIQAAALLSILSADDKKIVLLHTVYGFKHREIAEITGLPLGTVTWRYKQSIDRMKAAGKDSDSQKKQKEVTRNEK
jgi:RNA polymerase sigma-70 factor (ECF subfamily)